jgi:hypothetical protein
MQISRRNFIGTTASAAAIGSLIVPRMLVLPFGVADSTYYPNWRDQGVLYVDKSPYAKLHNIPVHAVTITKGFWGVRREINVDSSIPSMEKLLEANGRLTNFLRLAKQSDAPQKGWKQSASRCSPATSPSFAHKRTT